MLRRAILLLPNCSGGTFWVKSPGLCFSLSPLLTCFSNWASHYKTNCGRGYIFTSLFAFHLFTRGTLSLPKFKGILIIFKGSFLLLQWGYGFNGLLGIDFKNKIKQNPFPYGENKLQEQPIFPWHSVASPFSFLIKSACFYGLHLAFTCFWICEISTITTSDFSMASLDHELP